MSSSLPSPILRKSTTTAVPFASCNRPASSVSSRLLGAIRVLLSLSVSIDRSSEAAVGTRDDIRSAMSVSVAWEKARFRDRLPSAMPVAWRVWLVIRGKGQYPSSQAGITSNIHASKKSQEDPFRSIPVAAKASRKVLDELRAERLLRFWGAGQIRRRDLLCWRLEEDVQCGNGRCRVVGFRTVEIVDARRPAVRSYERSA